MKNKLSFGFSIIELSIVLVVMGIMTTTFLPALLRTLQAEKMIANRQAVQMARDEILGQAIIRHQLPASILDISHPEDAWGSELFYLNATNLGDDICEFNAEAENASLSLNSSSERIIDNLAFIIGSKGKNRVVDTDLQSSPVKLYEQGSISPVSSQKTDDIVEYISLPYLRTQLRCP